jgi:hypothetical protein
MAQRLGLPNAGLSRPQEMLRVTKITSNIGCAIGVTIGCLLGMFPLLFLETRKCGSSLVGADGDEGSAVALGAVGKGGRAAQQVVVDEGRIDGMFMAVGTELPHVCIYVSMYLCIYVCTLVDFTTLTD